MGRSKNIQVTYTEEEIAEIKKCAFEKGLTLAMYVKTKSLENSEFMERFTYLCDEVEKLEEGTKFEIKAVFGTKWNQIEKGMRLSLGRNFYWSTETGTVDVAVSDRSYSRSIVYIKL
jgi:hypothetical protein